MVWSFSISGERGSCLVQLDESLAKAARMEKALGEDDADDTAVDEYFDNIDKQCRSLIEVAPESSHLSMSLSGDAHTGQFSCSFNQPAEPPRKGKK